MNRIAHNYGLSADSSVTSNHVDITVSMVMFISIVDNFNYWIKSEFSVFVFTMSWDLLLER